MSQCDKIRTTHTARGLIRYEVRVWHPELGKQQVIQGENRNVVQQKAQEKMRQWDEMWGSRVAEERKRQERHKHARDIAAKKDEAEQRTVEAQQALVELDMILAHALKIDHTFDWETLKSHAEFAVPSPTAPVPPLKPGLEPERTSATYHIYLDLLDMIFPTRREGKRRKVAERFEQDHRAWADRVSAYQQELEAQAQAHAEATAQWKQQRAEFYQTRDAHNNAIYMRKLRYLRADPEAVLDYCDLVLTYSQYPDYFPQSYEIYYHLRDKNLVIDYRLPTLDMLPTLREVKYIQSRDEFSEKTITQTQHRLMFDNVCYQIALRTIYELCEADQIDAFASIVFNGYCTSVDPTTGQEGMPCILSLYVSKDTFAAINLADIDPKSCFRSLTHAASARLYHCKPVTPLRKTERIQR